MFEQGDTMIATAQIIAVGDEVLSGETINTNAAYLAQKLLAWGVRPVAHVVVGDDLDAIARAVRLALSQVDLTVLVGGLGPTPDDRTKDAVAEVTQRSLQRDDALFDAIARRHSRRQGWEKSIHRQALVLPGATIWPNRVGTAPGQLLEYQSRYVVLLPGPPKEMAAVAEDHLRPWLAAQGAIPIRRESLLVFDDGESTVASYLDTLLSGQHPVTGIYAQPGRIELRLQGRDTPHDTVLLARAKGWIRGRYPGPVYALNGRSREEILLQTLRKRGLRLAAMESLTGGMVLSRLIDWPGASDVVRGGAVAYTDDAKIRLGIPVDIIRQNGAVSPECVRAMALRARALFATDIGVSTTGFAGPTGGTERDPVGTFYVGVAWGDDVYIGRRQTLLSRQGVRQAATEMAISMLWKTLGLLEEDAAVKAPG